MAEKFSIHRLVHAELTPRLQSGERLKLRTFAEELFDEHMDDFLQDARDSAIHRVIEIARNIMSEAVRIKQGSFSFGDLPIALAVPVEGPTASYEYVGIEHATRSEARLALASLMTQNNRLIDRIRAVETFVVTAEARGCPDEGVLFDYLNGDRGSTQTYVAALPPWES